MGIALVVSGTYSFIPFRVCHESIVPYSRPSAPTRGCRETDFRMMMKNTALVGVGRMNTACLDGQDGVAFWRNAPAPSSPVVGETAAGQSLEFNTKFTRI
jgi:hypothetical protein